MNLGDFRPRDDVATIADRTWGWEHRLSPDPFDEELLPPSVRRALDEIPGVDSPSSVPRGSRRASTATDVQRLAGATSLRTGEPTPSWPCQVCNTPGHWTLVKGRACADCQAEIAKWDLPNEVERLHDALDRIEEHERQARKDS